MAGSERPSPTRSDVTFVGSALRYRDPAFLNSPGFDEFPAEFRDLLKVVPANLYDGSLQVRQTIFSFSLASAVRAARHGLSMGREQVRHAELAVVLDATRSYNALLLSLERVRVAEKTQRQKERHLEMARHRRTAGVVTDLDVLRSEVDLENQRAQLLRAQGQADLARGASMPSCCARSTRRIEPQDTLATCPSTSPWSRWSKRPWPIDRS